MPGVSAGRTELLRVTQCLGLEFPGEFFSQSPGIREGITQKLGQECLLISSPVALTSGLVVLGRLDSLHNGPGFQGQDFQQMRKKRPDLKAWNIQHHIYYISEVK